MLAPVHARAAAAAAVAVMSVTTLAFGQATGPAPGEEPPTLPPVVVSATRGERSVEDLPVSATVIEREEIVHSPGRSIEEVLRAQPGVQLHFDNSDVLFSLIPTLSIRGVGVGDTATRALVLRDGIPMNGGFFGQVLFNRVPKQNIERVEIVRGASSSLYGSYGLGGTINIVTRVPTQREVEVEAQAGQNERYQGNVHYGDVFNSRAVALGLNANYYETKGFLRQLEENRTPIEERQGGRLYNLQGRTDVRLSDSMKGFVRMGYNGQQLFGGFPRQKVDTDVGDIALGLDIDAGDAGLINLRTFYTREQYDVHNVNVPDPFTSFVSNRHKTFSDDVGASAQWSRGFRGLLSRLTFGTDFRWIQGEDDQDIFNAPATPRASRVIGEGTQTSLGVFGEVSLKPIDTLEILGNLRFDAFFDTNGRITTDGVTQHFSDRTLTILSPRVAARWQFSEPAAVRASYYQGFRAPTLAQRYRSFESPTFRGLGNPDLDEERLRGGDLGVDVRWGRLTTQLTGFYAHMKDFVGSADVGFVNGKFTVMNANVAEIRSRGVELGTTLRILDDLLFTTNYTYTDAEVVKGPLKGFDVENLGDEKYIADGFGVILGAPRQFSGGVRVIF
jgi:outer membrane receptor protein involved in Fe transport